MNLNCRIDFFLFLANFLSEDSELENCEKPGIKPAAQVVL